LRERQKRNMLATLLLSQGMPMILAGDEFGRTQGGNNNAYCQDNEISWLDWEGVSEEGRALMIFARKLIVLRDTLPVLRRGRFLTGQWNGTLGVKDVTWVNAAANEMKPEEWHDGNMRCFGMLMDGRAQATGIMRPASDATLLLVVNAHHDVVVFTLPEVAGANRWYCLLDTNDPDRGELPDFTSHDRYEVAGRSLLLFALEAHGETGRVLRRLAVELSGDSRSRRP
jgi:glycogen operon protein